MIRHEKIYKRPDGSRVMVKVTFHLNRELPVWERMVFTCEPKKRTFINVVDHNSYDFRRLPFNGEERNQYIRSKNAGAATLKEMQEVEKELWMKLKP